MSENSKIQWTDHTFNPWWGCARVSAGCEHCYAERDAARWGTKWGVNAERRFFGDKHWNDPIRWDRAAAKAGVRRRVFCASMADVFEDREDLYPQRARLWKLIQATPNLDWLLLTKRPQFFDVMLPWTKLANGTPWPNVWLGVTVEDQKRADERIPALLATPAVVRFLSCEPLLGPVDLRPQADFAYKMLSRFYGSGTFDPEGKSPEHERVAGKFPNVDWVIIGGESGPGARPFDLAWARALLAQCRDGKAAPFVKQLGAQPVVGGLVRRASGIESRKGDDMAEWPEDLRVREFPAVRS